MKREYPDFIWMVFPNPDNGCNEWYLGCDPPETKEESKKYIPAPEKKSGADTLVDFIQNAIDLDHYNQLTDKEFADAVLEEYWADLDIDDPMSTILSMAIERLRGEHVVFTHDNRRNS